MSKAKRPAPQKPRKLRAGCKWCGRGFVATRDDAGTCSGRCRTALCRYIRAHGVPPFVPPGRAKGA